VILARHGKGLVASLQCVKPGTTEPDPQLAFRVVGRAVQCGVLLFGPVGYGGASVKVCPPLVIAEDARLEGIEVLEAAFEHVLEGQAVAR
jgi:4-aminobutyrate aminotransferase-like enzyme